ncbi:MAG: phosphatidate cytidylyltransferase [Elusimicrobiota bacterium]|jgi:phosphatidate cytidylyltransferase|nr:phosphatidate cytidylyltransferase [Elusimicrobiota bacterium]
MLKTRILTALLGIPIIFICIYLGGWLFFSLMFLVNFFCIKEYLNICKKYNPSVFISLILGALYFISLSFHQKQSIEMLMFEAVVIFLVFFVLEIYRQKPNNATERICVSFFGTFFFPTTLSFMIFIRELYSGGEYIFLFFITVWVLDTAAYAAGKKFGKHKLSPSISPKKTVEGAAAGLIFGIITSIVIGNFVFDLFTIKQAALLGLIIAICGQFSDLAESLIKRDADIKDSGKILPGHGGVLDRFDSYFFAAPIVYFVLVFLQGSNY